MKRTAAIVLNWRRPQDTLRCVESLMAIDRPLDVIVLDNASGDGSMEVLRAGLPGLAQAAGAGFVETPPPPAYLPWAPGDQRTLALIQTGRNGGYAFGNNVGIAAALQRDDVGYVWVLNNDTTVPGPRSLDALIARMEADPTIGICGSTVAYLGQETVIQTRAGGEFRPLLGRCHPLGFRERLSDPADRDAIERRLAYVNGAAAFVRRDFIEAVGMMTEDYFLYFEEIDWALRGKRRFRLGYAPESLVLHAVGAAIGTDDFGSPSPLSQYYLARNRVKFLSRFSPLSLPLAVLDMLKNSWREYRKGGHAGAKAMLQGVLGQGFVRTDAG